MSLIGMNYVNTRIPIDFGDLVSYEQGKYHGKGIVTQYLGSITSPEFKGKKNVFGVWPLDKPKYKVVYLNRKNLSLLEKNYDTDIYEDPPSHSSSESESHSSSYSSSHSSSSESESYSSSESESHSSDSEERNRKRRRRRRSRCHKKK